MSHCGLNPSAHILETVKPTLAGRLASLSLTERRAAVAKACKQVAESIPNLEPEMSALVDSCVRENHLSQGQVATAESFAKWADRRYFDLRDRGVHEDVWRTWFQKARLATAIASAFVGDSWECAANAIYELTAVLESPSPLIEMVEFEIGRAKR